MSSSIHRESENIFAAAPLHDEEEEEADEEEECPTEQKGSAPSDEHGSELTAAAALTSLVVSSQKPTTSSSSKEAEDDDEEDDDEEEDDDGEGGDEGMELEIPQRFTKSGRKRAVSFPLKLLKVLSTKRHADVIAWTPSGKAFEIRKPKQFVAEILPKYFKSAKYSSFTRKLHRWNFQRHYRGEEAGAFYHKDFVKDRLDLVEQMTCKLEGAGGAPTVAVKPPQKKSKAPAASRKKPAGAPSNNGAPASYPSQQPIVTVNASQAIHQNGPSLPLSSRIPVAEPSPAAVDLNAAIEMEVARRLEERISAAAFSRQALAMLEQQQQQQQQIQARLNALMERRYQALIGQQNNLTGPLRHQQYPLATSAPPQQPQPPLDLAQIYRKLQKPAPSFNYAFGDGTPSLPPTNIQGARTA